MTTSSERSSASGRPWGISAGRRDLSPISVRLRLMGLQLKWGRFALGFGIWTWTDEPPISNPYQQQAMKEPPQEGDLGSVPL